MSDPTAARHLERTIALMRVSESVTLTGPALENVLRALAGAPTADVAVEAAAQRLREDGFHKGHVLDLRGDVASDARAVLAHVLSGGALAAAPEGAPTADVAEIERLRRIERAARSAMFDRPSAPGRGELRALLAVAPEGVDAADELCQGCGGELPDPRNPMPDDYLCDDCVSEDDDGMDVEAQGEMADELTAAQAAIQRVRDYLADRGSVLMFGAMEVVLKAGVLRALDGDTAEEKR